MKRLGWWLMNNVPLGPLAPPLLGLLLGKRGTRQRTLAVASPEDEWDDVTDGLRGELP